MKSINIKYIWDKSTFLKASESLYEYQLKHSKKRFLGWFFIALVQFGVVFALKQGTFGLLLLSSLLSLYWYILRWPMRRWMLSRGFDKSPLQNHTFNIQTSSSGLVVDDKLIIWNDIIEVICMTNGLIFFIGHDFMFVPFDAFDTASEQTNFLATIKKSVSSYIKE